MPVQVATSGTRKLSHWHLRLFKLTQYNYALSKLYGCRTRTGHRARRLQV